MSDFTQKNFKEIDNLGRRPRARDVEARFARKHLDSEHLGVSYFRVPPDFRAPIGHRHREQEEAYVVVEGSGRLRLDDEIIDVRQWDVIRVAPDVVRAFEGGPDGPRPTSPLATTGPRAATARWSRTSGPTDRQSRRAPGRPERPYERAIDAGSVRSSRVMVTLASSVALAEPAVDALDRRDVGVVAAVPDLDVGLAGEHPVGRVRADPHRLAAVGHRQQRLEPGVGVDLD